MSVGNKNKGEKGMDKVVFRVIRGEVNAFIPDIKANAGNILCYAHVGQHSEASLGYYRLGRLATPEEYAALKAELESIGYKVKVIKRITRS
jgi:hypothetical protein